MDDAPRVAKGYQLILDFFQKATRLLIMQGFMLWKSNTPEARYVVVAMPLMMGILGLLQVKRVTRVMTNQDDTELECSLLVDEVEAKYELIADYAQRPQLNQ